KRNYNACGVGRTKMLRRPSAPTLCDQTRFLNLPEVRPDGGRLKAQGVGDDVNCLASDSHSRLSQNFSKSPLTSLPGFRRFFLREADCWFYEERKECLTQTPAARPWPSAVTSRPECL